MKAFDLRDLINGLIAVIVLSIALGQYGKLREFAKKEFVRSMKNSSSPKSARY
ncbi:MAG: hypothetical protein KA715_09425 [Xanthomonadaceae bacterium]|nr:hypothetical protein [Xanthomonadaceae bacterium]